MSVALQWNLDQTAGSFFSVARGILLAANHDNVQPIAILSCERFGSTVAMCEETCNKIESLISKPARPAAIKFLQSYVGLDAADCATQLSKNQAGLRFLGLAAALVNSMTIHDASTILRHMLDVSALDQTLVPTTRQLRDLLEALQPRLLKSGFLNTVVGWDTLLSQSPSDGGTKWPSYHLMLPGSYPDVAGVANLVEAFRLLARIGDSDVERIEIEAASFVPWIVAFTKWCIGTPPSIYCYDGTPFLEQRDSKVSLRVEQGRPRRVRVSIIRALSSTHELIRVEPVGPVQTIPSNYLTGMLDLETFGMNTLAGFGYPSSTEGYREGLPLAMQQIITQLRFSKYRVFDPSSSFADWGYEQYNNGPQVEEALLTLGLKPFPEEHIIAKTLSRYLGSRVLIEFQPMATTPVREIPPISTFLGKVKDRCRCGGCDSNTDHVGYPSCQIKMFWERFCLACADVLAMSLFEQSGEAWIFLKHSTRRGNSKLQEAIKLILTTGAVAYIKPYDLVCHALELVGHELHDGLSDEDCFQGQDGIYRQGTMVMSSFRGQVVFPTIFETYHLNNSGYLALTCLPGLLHYDGQVYQRAVARMSNLMQPQIGAMLPGRAAYAAPVNGPRKLIHSSRIRWMIDVSDNNTLTVCLGFQDGHPPTVRATCLMYRLFETLASAFFVESCQHDAEQHLAVPDDYCIYTSPLYPRPLDDYRDGTQIVGVAAVSGLEEMRFLTVANAEPVVIRGKACLSCCLEVCRKSKYPVLVL